MITKTNLYGENIYLGCLEHTNISNNYLSWMNNAEVMKYTESRFSPHDESSLSLYVRETNESSDSLLLGIFEKNSGEHIGNLKIGPISFEHLKSYIGVVIGSREHWNQGIGSQAISLATQYAIQQIGLTIVYAGVYSNNIASIRAFSKAGFQRVAQIPQYWLADDKAVDEIILSYPKNRLNLSIAQDEHAQI